MEAEVTRKILTCIGLAALLWSLTAAAALGATYTGRSPEDPKVRVSFVRDHGKIRRFTIERAKFFCTDGDRFRDGARVGVMRLRDHRFEGYFTAADGGASAHVAGKIFRPKARGTFRLVAAFGAVQCTTRRVDWRAHRST